MFSYYYYFQDLVNKEEKLESKNNTGVRITLQKSLKYLMKKFVQFWPVKLYMVRKQNKLALRSVVTYKLNVFRMDELVIINSYFSACMNIGRQYSDMLIIKTIQQVFQEEYSTINLAIIATTEHRKQLRLSYWAIPYL